MRIGLRLLFPLACLMGVLVSSCSRPRVKPSLPCQSPQALMQALDYALNTSDKDLLWQLYTWTNVSPAFARIEKNIQLQFQPEKSGDKSSFYAFRVVTPLPPDFIDIASRTDPTKPHYNIPIQGVIYCNQKMRKNGIRSSFPGLEFPYGQMPDGAYVVAVMIKDSGTNGAGRRQ